MAGSVSGGCVEGAVVEEAQSLLEEGGARLLEYGVTNDEAWEVGLACGGRVTVHVIPATLDLVEGLIEAIEAKRWAGMTVDVETGRASRVSMPGAPATPADDPVTEWAGAEPRALAGRELILDHDEAPEAYLRVFAPAPRLVIVGAVHIAQALCGMASHLGFNVVVVDPRRAFATPERFPGTELVHAWPDGALPGLDLDAGTAVVTLTHDPKLDDPALIGALATPVFYIGALGSRRTQERRLARLRDAGIGDEELTRIHGPIGLDLGAETPAEIALAVLAEILRARRGREPGGPGPE